MIWGVTSFTSRYYNTSIWPPLYNQRAVIRIIWLCHLPISITLYTLQWRHTDRDGVSNHQPHDCLFNRLFKAQIKEISKLRVTGHCEGNSPVTGEFPAQRASNAAKVSIWWRQHVYFNKLQWTRIKFYNWGWEVFVVYNDCSCSMAILQWK